MNFNYYRPESIDDFIGQEDVKFSIKVYLESAIVKNNNLDHILIIGPSGVGKTTLARIIALKMKQNITYAQGSNLQKISDILNLFSLVNENDIIFIDEIHKIDKSIIEMLYVMIEDFVIDVPIGADNNQKITRLQLPKFTLIAATNYLSKLPKPLVDRFPISFSLNNYTDDEIYQILYNICAKNDFKVKPADLNYIASLSKQNPRIAINLLKRYYDFSLNCQNLDVKEIFMKIGYYPEGFNKLDIEYMKLLKETKYLSLTSIAQSLGFDKNTIEMNIETYLLKKSFIEITSRGRMLTEKAINYLEKNLLIK